MVIEEKNKLIALISVYNALIKVIYSTLICAIILNFLDFKIFTTNFLLIIACISIYISVELFKNILGTLYSVPDILNILVMDDLEIDHILFRQKIRVN